MIIDRALPHGGWNYGNKVVFGHELRPQPGPTGMALLALATRARQRDGRVRLTRPSRTLLKDFQA